MPEADFEALREFYVTDPFDDLHRYHRPAALVASSMGGTFAKALAVLRPPPPTDIPAHGNFSDADMRSMLALGLTRPKR